MLISCKSLSIHAILWALVILEYMPLHFGFIGIWPNLLLLYVICITLRYPSAAFLFFSLLAGLFNDLIAGNVIGITSMEFAIVAASMHYNARFLANQSFKFTWLSILGLIIICTSAGALINYMLLSKWLVDYTTLINCFITACFYPTMYRLIVPLQRGGDTSDAR